jgi:hypothetical protein
MAVPKVRHVWVRPPHTPTAMPGLVLVWRPLADGWEALVIWVEPRGRTITDWLPATCLTPRPGTPTTGSAYG